jgi:serine/threonine protein kinase
MEYLDGLNLDDLVKRFGPLPEGRVLFILKQICGALAEAHAFGLVHRDIKPANIFLTVRGGLNDFVKVLDFGLVKALESDEKANLTNPNAITGTPFYLSPEAVLQPDQVDARADVYAVGAVGYYLLTGTPVFSGASVVEICMKHSKEVPELPSVRRGKPVSAVLEGLLMRCLAKAPTDRARDAGELLRELEACPIVGQWTATDAAAWWASQSSAMKSEAGKVSPEHHHETPAPDMTMAYPGSRGDS